MMKLSKVLILIIFLFASAFILGNVHARQVNICQGQAEFISQITAVRDAGWPKEFVLSLIEFQDSAQGRQASLEVPLWFDEIYKSENQKKTPEEMGKAYYRSCLGLPDWPQDEVKI